jgi:Xaa-Pro dipeptidase
MIAVEPKFVLPGRGMVGIENTSAVFKRGEIKLTDIPDRLVSI